MKWLTMILLMMALHGNALADDCLEPGTGKPVPCPVVR